MTFGHEKLDVYRLSLDSVALVYQLAERLDGKSRHARDQLLRASQSIPLNIAEDNGKVTAADRRRFFEIARGSTLECAAIEDVLFVAEVTSESENVRAKEILNRIAAMLTRLGGRGYSVKDLESTYDDEAITR